MEILEMKDFEISALPEESVSFGRDILSVPVIVAAVGVSGAILANYIAKFFDWRTVGLVFGDFIIINAGAVVGVLCMMIAFYALYRLEETFYKDLNYIEE
ncbi:MAG: hypothetical protein QMD01_06325 [Thermodesulfovibrionales bacterium]|nr:hypothetical protein [Thermodesulfovibrionales bacterium]